MDNYGIWSVLPPVIAIVLAIRSRQVFLSLTAGILIAYLIIEGWNPIAAFMSTLDTIVGVMKDPGNTRTIFFCTLVGGLIASVQRSGGVEGFMNLILKRTERKELKNAGRSMELYAYLTGFVLFVETSISSLTVGTLFRPLFDKFNLSREKLALMADTSSAPSSILIPFNAWGAFIMSIMLANGIIEPFGMLIRSMPFNFYPLILVPLMLYFIFSRREIGPMKSTLPRQSDPPNEATGPENDVVTSASSSLISADIRPRVWNLLLPIGAMVISMPVILVATGWEGVQAATFAGKLFAAMGSGSGSTAVLIAVIIGLIVSGMQMITQKRMPLGKWIDLVVEGSASLFSLALLMLLAFAIGQACRDLYTGQYVAGVLNNFINPMFLPALIFVISAFIAFSTGTSWGTFAIMLTIAIPMSQDMALYMPLIVAAVLSGGVFGDHCSPISDTTIISSLASGTDHIAHVRTQLPYAMLAGGIAVVCFLVAGALFSF
jgi:tetracycline resistance efflux pump